MLHSEVVQTTEEMMTKAKEIVEWLEAHTSGPKEGSCVIALVQTFLNEAYGVKSEAHTVNTLDKTFQQAKGEA